VTAVTAGLRDAPERAPGPCVDPVDLTDRIDLPGRTVDPLAQAWEQILAAVLAEGPPEDPFDGPGDRVAESLDVLRVAGAPVPAGDLDGPAVAAALAVVDLGSAAVADAEVVARWRRRPGWRRGRPAGRSRRPWS
jgi:hypothetical protein